MAKSFTLDDTLKEHNTALGFLCYLLTDLGRKARSPVFLDNTGPSELYHLEFEERSFLFKVRSAREIVTRIWVEVELTWPCQSPGYQNCSRELSNLRLRGSQE